MYGYIDRIRFQSKVASTSHVSRPSLLQSPPVRPPADLTPARPHRTAPHRTAATVARVGVDQFVLTPCVLTLFFTCQSLLEGKGFGEARRRIETSWWPTIQANWGSASRFLCPRVDIIKGRLADL